MIVLENRLDDARIQLLAMQGHINNVQMDNEKFDRKFIVAQCQNLIKKVVEIQQEACQIKGETDE